VAFLIKVAVTTTKIDIIANDKNISFIKTSQNTNN